MYETHIGILLSLFGSSLPPVGGLMSYLRYLCLFAHSGVQYILYCVLVSFSSPSEPYVVSFSDCPFLIAPSVFSDVHVSRYRQDKSSFTHILGYELC